MKKIFAMLLCALLMFCVGVPACAAEGGAPQPLQFRRDGTFRILNYCDLHSSYPLTEASTAFMEESIAVLKPDLVVLGGDNCVSSAEDKEKCIREICASFVDSGTYFTLVFGNHDDEQGVDKETLLGCYQKYGGQYCLAYDAVPELTGVGTHNLPILSADGGRTAYNVWLFDSNTYAYDEAGNKLGYDAVHPDEIEWYKSTAAALAQQNGGKVVPAMAFQHIIVMESYDALFYKSPVTSDKLRGALAIFPVNHFDGVSFTYLPKIASLQSGLMLEKPCPGYYNYGQLDAMAEVGDVRAVYSGHDHTNDFTLHLKGVDVINTPSCSFRATTNNINRGVRVVDLAEDGGYETHVYYAAEHILKTDSKIPQAEGGMSKARAFFDNLARIFLNALVKVLKIPFFFAK